MRTQLLALFLLGGLACSACGEASESDLGQAVHFEVDAAFQEAPPPNVHGFMYWTVRSAASDDPYVFGKVSLSDKSAHVSFEREPPAEARNGGGFSVGVVVVHTGEPVTEGLAPPIPAQSATIALSHDYAVVFRARSDEAPARAWVENFPLGYSCGRCVRVVGQHDGYEPVSCADFRVTPVGQGHKACNWT